MYSAERVGKVVAHANHGNVVGHGQPNFRNDLTDRFDPHVLQHENRIRPVLVPKSSLNVAKLQGFCSACSAEQKIDR